MVNITKRNGTKESLDIDKIHRVLQWACQDIENVSVSAIELASRIQFYNGITSAAIQETLIKAASELITEETPNYQYVAGRIIYIHNRRV